VQRHGSLKADTMKQSSLRKCAGFACAAKKAGSIMFPTTSFFCLQQNKNPQKVFILLQIFSKVFAVKIKNTPPPSGGAIAYGQ